MANIDLKQVNFLRNITLVSEKSLTSLSYDNDTLRITESKVFNFKSNNQFSLIDGYYLDPYLIVLIEGNQDDIDSGNNPDKKPEDGKGADVKNKEK